MFYNRKNITLEALNKMFDNTMAANLGMEVTEIGDDFLIVKMPVDDRTKQSYGMLNGGASLALAETVGSLAANLAVTPEKACFGLDINGNHIRAARDGFVFGKASPLHIGSTTHVWEIKITDEHDKLICIARLTMAITDKKL